VSDEPITISFTACATCRFRCNDDWADDDRADDLCYLCADGTKRKPSAEVVTISLPPEGAQALVEALEPLLRHRNPSEGLLEAYSALTARLSEWAGDTDRRQAEWEDALFRSRGGDHNAVLVSTSLLVAEEEGIALTALHMEQIEPNTAHYYDEVWED
jgi:hypothetical protein